ncbi:MAG: hypothetical protein IPO93_00350 [Actinobacteria bacterium]|nr:hypothetical protein [Actinomycetota bacterium]
MAPSRRPIVDALGTTWLGDPEGGEASIEIADDFIGLYTGDQETRVPWSEVAALQVDIPTSRWRLANVSYWAVSVMDAVEAVGSTMTTSSSSAGVTDIEVRLTLRDGTEVSGSARKHQPLGYPRPEVEAAVAVLRGRVGPSGV